MSADEFVLAVLLVDGRYVLQLRDNKPNIDAPGVWGLFGGRIEPGEQASEAVVREVREELCVEMHDSRLLWKTDEPERSTGPSRRYWFFEADFTDGWAQHCLTEGRAARCFSFSELANLPMPDLIRHALTRHHLACLSR